MTKHLGVLLGWLLAAGCAGAQIISTLVGNPADGAPARATPLWRPGAVAADSAGSIYIADDGSGAVRRIDPATGIASIISSSLRGPWGLAVGPDRLLYVTDARRQRILKIAPDGAQATVTGNGSFGFSGDGGLATRAQVSLPQGIALDAAGNLYIADSDNHAVRKVHAASGIITTIAGGVGAAGGAVALQYPWGITVDGAGNVFFTDTYANVVRKIEAAGGLLRTVAGNGRRGNTGAATTAGAPVIPDAGAGDGGPAMAASLDLPTGLALAPNGDLYIGQTGRVRKVAAATGIITTVLGGGSHRLADAEGHRGTEVSLPGRVGHLFLGRSNVLLVTLPDDNIVARLDLNTGGFGIIAGDPRWVGDGSRAAIAVLAQPRKLALDAAGNLYVADTGHDRVLRVAPLNGQAGAGNITTVAGAGVGGFLSAPEGIFLDSENTLYVTDQGTSLRKLGPDGTLRAVAGTAERGFSGDGGPAAAALLNSIGVIVADGEGNLYFADNGNRRVRHVDSRGVIRTLAGTGEFGYSGDGGPATRAEFTWISDLLLHRKRGLLLADLNNYRVRRLDLATGIITAFAGNGEPGRSGDAGPATAAGIGSPLALASDAQGNVYIASRDAVRRIDAVTGVITTVVAADSRARGGTGDSPGPLRLGKPDGLVVDGAGHIIFSDSESSRVRRIVVGPAP